MIRSSTLVACLGLALGTNAMLMAADAPKVKAAPDRTITLAPTEKPLDDRIDNSKITNAEPPPLPEQVILPMPPTHRIAIDPSEVPIDSAHYDKAITAMRKGLAYLRTQQASDGSWLGHIRIAPTHQPDQPSAVAVAVTALAVKAFLQDDVSPINDPNLVRAMSVIKRAQSADGSYSSGALTNYATAAVVSALAALDKNEMDFEMRQATTWLTTSQWDQTEGLNADQDWFGGAGYGNRGRPDLSNTQMMLDALYDSGMSPDEPAYQRALAFVSRTQNLSKTNNSVWAGDDGGFIYTPANGGESMASEAAGEGRYGELIPEGQPRSLRSYGSMTYAGFKSMLYAGLSADDIRVRAAFDWLRKHWTFDKNPGLDQQGLFYYHHTLARALYVAQQETINDVDGEAHNWREELIDAIVKRQHEDGSWKNDADRWLEGEPVMATIYEVLTLQETLKPVLIAP